MGSLIKMRKLPINLIKIDNQGNSLKKYFQAPGDKKNRVAFGDPEK
jgi:hypothetical protein